IGAIAGSMALNAVSSATASSANQWVYVYGDAKQTQKNFNALLTAINKGADVKIVNLTETVDSTVTNTIYCNSIKAYPSGPIHCDAFGFSTSYSQEKATVLQHNYNVQIYKGPGQAYAVSIFDVKMSGFPDATTLFNFDRLNGSIAKPTKVFVKY
ncbi:MAG: hypothetical protein AAB791_00890, partial [Patescibacteria group bacterium]